MEERDYYSRFSREIWRSFERSAFAQNRKGATYSQWLRRSEPARQAMAERLANSEVVNENPYFWVMRFPEPQPTNYNGARSLPGEPMVRAIYNGKGGLYTRREAELFNMQILGAF